jgi:hypothetical protein
MEAITPAVRRIGVSNSGAPTFGLGTDASAQNATSGNSLTGRIHHLLQKSFYVERKFRAALIMQGPGHSPQIGQPMG